MEKDHLDKETSVSAEITASGIKAGAQSRFVAAVDRLGGALVDVVSAHIEGHTNRRRAKTEGEVNLIKAITQYGVDHLGADPARAERAVQMHFRKILREQENTEAVLQEALEDLSSNPPDEASSANQTELSEEFLDRFEDYSAAASTDELRKRWGRVLASEIRRPGTASRKVLRLVDELDSETALLFEDFAKNRIGRLIPKALVGEANFRLMTRLFLSGLISSSSSDGQIRFFTKVIDNAGEEVLLISLNDIVALGIPGESKIEYDKSESAALISFNGNIGLSCYLLTDEGESISSILPDRQDSTIIDFANKINSENKVDWIRLYQKKDGDYIVFSEIRRVGGSPATEV